MSHELLEPFTTHLDLDLGALDPVRAVTERSLTDMKGMYMEESDGEDAIVYRVYAIPAPQVNSHVICSTTVLEPGAVGREYYMTKGHFHEIRDRAEVYIGLSGEGLLVLATEGGRTVTQPQQRGSVNYIPGGWAHRSVNTSDEPLVFFAAYIADAGHDYASIERSGFPVVVVKGDDGPQVIPNPKYGG